ncbi:UbiA family prenyltransferase [Candidatus Parcubacteria bacterium]|nr:UbiA family prenyltransferase [Patescibacteria group bacterium]MCG2690485.1 UbiA family prenyltransferase [Candidatus Parcubacteria bacterium]
MRLKFFRRIIDLLENSKVPFGYFIASFLFIVFLRSFLEIFSSLARFELMQFYHYCLFYITIALFLTLLFKIIIKIELEKIFRVILPTFVIIFVPPIIDLIVCLKKACIMTYLLPSPIHSDNLLYRFFTLGGEYKIIGGITPGIKIELILIIIGSFFYFLIKNKGIIKSLFFSFLTYSIVFIYLIAPIWLNYFLKIFGKSFNYNFNLDFVNLYFLLIVLLSSILFYLYNKNYFKAIIGDLRILRLLHFWLMLILGIVIGNAYVNKIGAGFNLYSFIPFPLITVLMVILLAWLYSVITNNIEDKEIDKISNPTRPLITTISLDVYKKLAAVILIFIIASSLAIGFEAFFIILIFIGNYFLYSLPPFRLKRITLFSKLIISFNSLILMILGYILGYVYIDGVDISQTIRSFPDSLILYILVFFTLAINFIDIKDYKGDKAAGIKTLPVILGLKKSQKIIGLFFLSAYIAAYFFFNFPFFFIYIFIILGIIQFLLINRQRYSEKPIFIVYLITLLIVIFFKK